MRHVVPWMQEGGSRCEACFVRNGRECHECGRPLPPLESTLSSGRWFHSHRCYDAWCRRAAKFQFEGFVDAAEQADLTSVANRHGVDVSEEPPPKRAIALDGRLP